MKRYIFLLVAAVVCAVSCSKPYSNGPDSEHYLMTLVNSSSYNTIWVIPEHGQKGCEYSGELPDDLESGARVAIYKLESGTRLHINIYDTGVASVFQTYHPKDELKIYVFDASVYNGNTWENLKKNRMWLSKLSITAKDVIDENKEVIFRK